MGSPSQRGEIAPGDDVFGADNARVGTVARVYPGYLVVEKGAFLPADCFIPMGAVAGAGGGQVALTVPRDAALQSGWDVAPADLETAICPPPPAHGAANRLADHPTEIADLMECEELHIPLVEEMLMATVRPAELAPVRIAKRVMTENRVLDVPVTEAEIRVERRIVAAPEDAPDLEAIEQIIIEIPVRRERVDLQRAARIREEIVVTKDVTHRTEHVADTVRRTEVFVNEQPIEETLSIEAEGGSPAG